MSTDPIYDVAIIGGGINGCGSAADAALRGLSVILCEQGDIASGTSSASTKLIHGGLRYLESYEFRLVKKALDERQLLLKLAPHLVHPQSFVIPFQKGLRKNYLVRLGLWLYDHLSRKNALPHSQKITHANSPYFIPLKDTYKEGVIYYDATTDDARLTLVNALQAQKYGATILTYTRLINAEVKNGIWLLTLQHNQEAPFQIRAKCVINATGPWVHYVANLLKTPALQAITWVKGSHFVIPALYKDNQAYLLQHKDNRIVFVIPYHGFSMIGTTDVAFEGSLDNVQIATAEVEYLIKLVGDFFKKPIVKEDIIYSWSGIRPLLADPEKALKALSRDYKHEYSHNPAPLVTIYGGKITTYRKLAKEVIDSLSKVLGNSTKSLTKTMPLPGAVTQNGLPFKEYRVIAAQSYSWLDSALLKRYLLTYGTHTEKVLANCTSIMDLGICFGQDLYQVEVEYLVKAEWATCVDDILFRRTKLGLMIHAIDIDKLAQFILIISPN